MADITHPRHLTPTRRHRSYPRVIKRARHNSYRVKRPGDTGTRHTHPATITLRPQLTTQTQDTNMINTS
ncbi:hypothetical protein [Streptomyces sp. NPDC056649]|uniref:hypothetical protein n=1 Tax=Streptomyces sp. NPDC056649 TaxID=3345891 RepID=UPI0036A2E5AF